MDLKTHLKCQIILNKKKKKNCEMLNLVCDDNTFTKNG